MQPATGPLRAEASPPSGPNPQSNAIKIGQAAKDFESLLLNQMLRSARESGGGGFSGSADDDSDANSTLMELGEQQFAQALASSGTLGIAKIVTAGLNKNAD